MRSRFAVLSALISLVVLTLPAIAQEDGADEDSTAAFRSSETKPTLPGLAARSGAPSVSSQLVAAAQARSGDGAEAVAADFPELRFVGDKVEVEVSFETLTTSRVSALEAAGLQVTHSSFQFGTVLGLVSLDDIGRIALVDGVDVLRAHFGAQTATGSVDNQADASIHADDARANLGVDGSGVTIGILSDSFDNLSGSTAGAGCARATTGSSSQASGDLPASVTNLADLGSGGSDEGRGMAELIHDLAPGSPLMFATAFIGGEPGFAANIRALRDCGADVIVDDVIYFAEPMFQDGVVAQAAQEVVVEDGIPYFSSAGNQATFGIDNTFRPSGDVPGFAFGGELHDFEQGAGEDRFAKITLGPGEGIRVFLQWDDPFDTNFGGPVGADSDFDIWLVDAASNGATALAGGATIQGCGLGAGVVGGDPFEGFAYTNATGSTQDVFVAITNFCRTGGKHHLRVATYGFGNSITSVDFWEDHFDDAQIYGHAAARNALAVAAVFFHEIDSGGTTQGGAATNFEAGIQVEPFSSLGGMIPIYFDDDGNPLATPEMRHKPEIAAPDGTNTTFFGSDSGFDPDSHPNFFGTSAAAPHAAAVAALMMDKKGKHTPGTVYFSMRDRATDIEAAGYDFRAGFGLIHAEDATTRALAKCLGKIADLVGTDFAETLIGTAGADVINAKKGDDFVDGLGGADHICLGHGDDIGIGGGGSDTITGQANDDTIDGGGGNDFINGKNGKDFIEGGAGNDTLLGKRGRDEIHGDEGDDDIEGGPGHDRIEGGADDDTMDGGSGNDKLFGQDGADEADGGPGNDRCVAEIQVNCEL
jgi:Ca2+-binding RTX toxin-like protein